MDAGQRRLRTWPGDGRHDDGQSPLHRARHWILGTILAAGLWLGIGELRAAEPPAPVVASAQASPAPSNEVLGDVTASEVGKTPAGEGEPAEPSPAVAPTSEWPVLSSVQAAQAFRQSPAALLIALALLPMALLLVTGFVKASVVLSILRAAMGLPQVPSNQVIALLAFVASAYAMAPTAWAVWQVAAPSAQTDGGASDGRAARDGAVPTRSGTGQAGSTGTSPPDGGPQGMAVADWAALLEPVRDFVARNADAREQAMLMELARDVRASQVRDGPPLPALAPQDWGVLAPAFLLTELREAFTVGFVLYLPFVLVDLVVAHLLLGLGLHNMSASTVSLPLKLLLFVAVDGWFLVLRGLVLGYV